jgi:hypothetical protein
VGTPPELTDIVAGGGSSSNVNSRSSPSGSVANTSMRDGTLTSNVTSWRPSKVGPRLASDCTPRRRPRGERPNRGRDGRRRLDAGQGTHGGLRHAARPGIGGSGAAARTLSPPTRPTESRLARRRMRRYVPRGRPRRSPGERPQTRRSTDTPERASMSEIVEIHGREILDSRGNPTLEVEVTLDRRGRPLCRALRRQHRRARGHRAARRRPGRYHGKGVLKAVQHVNDRHRQRELIGFPADDQRGLDARLIAWTARPTRATWAPTRCWA